MLYFTCNKIFIILPYDFSIGCATSATDGSSPRGYDWVLAANYRLKTSFFGFNIKLITFLFQNHYVIPDEDDIFLSGSKAEMSIGRVICSLQEMFKKTADMPINRESLDE
jgi:hypothetical protein